MSSFFPHLQQISSWREQGLQTMWYASFTVFWEHLTLKDMCKYKCHHFPTGTDYSRRLSGFFSYPWFKLKKRAIQHFTAIKQQCHTKTDLLWFWLLMFEGLQICGPTVSPRTPKQNGLDSGSSNRCCPGISNATSNKTGLGKNIWLKRNRMFN